MTDDEVRPTYLVHATEGASLTGSPWAAVPKGPFLYLSILLTFHVESRSYCRLSSFVLPPLPLWVRVLYEASLSPSNLDCSVSPSHTLSFRRGGS